jgi:hypothetical protein
MTENNLPKEGLFVSNEYTSEVVVAWASPDPECKGVHGSFRRQGWCIIPTNTHPNTPPTKILDIDCSGLEIGYYAYATDGTKYWNFETIPGPEKPQFTKLSTTIPAYPGPSFNVCLDTVYPNPVDFRVFHEEDHYAIVHLRKDN